MAATSLGTNSRIQKSPLIAKKSTSNTNQHQSGYHMQQQSLKQSVKQLGLSYGVIAKQDAHNKLIASKKQRTIKETTSPKKQHRRHAGGAN